jgi:hypothetical protein
MLSPLGRPRTRTLLITLLAVLASTIGFLELRPDRSGADSAPLGQAEAQTPSGTYSVFTRPPRASDSVESWRLPEFSGITLNTPAARRVAEDATKTVAAVPATGVDGPCLATRYSSGGTALNCAGSNGIIASIGYTGAIGLVPDSVTTVTLTMTDGSSRAATVADNTWRAPDDASQATFSLNGEQKIVRLMPRSSLPEGAKLSPDGLVTVGTPQADGGIPPTDFDG